MDSKSNLVIDHGGGMTMNDCPCFLKEFSLMEEASSGQEFLDPVFS
jgi:hypothetical protein